MFLCNNNVSYQTLKIYIYIYIYIHITNLYKYIYMYLWIHAFRKLFRNVAKFQYCRLASQC